MAAVADAPHSDPDDCFHCPQGDQPCPVTYQPGAWLVPPAAEPTAAVQNRAQRADDLTPVSSRPSANCPKRWPATPTTWPACRLTERAWGAGWRRDDSEGCCRSSPPSASLLSVAPPLCGLPIGRVRWFYDDGRTVTGPRTAAGRSTLRRAEQVATSRNDQRIDLLRRFRNDPSGRLYLVWVTRLMFIAALAA